jgi:hypothetical protein
LGTSGTLTKTCDALAEKGDAEHEERAKDLTSEQVEA